MTWQGKNTLDQYMTNFLSPKTAVKAQKFGKKFVCAVIAQPKYWYSSLTTLAPSLNTYITHCFKAKYMIKNLG